MIDFSTISKTYFSKLVNKGRLNPHGNEFNEIGMVIDGRKPVALVSEDLARFACGYKVNIGYITWDFVPQLDHRTAIMAKCGLFRAKDANPFYTLCAAYDLYPYDLTQGLVLDKKTVKFDIALGRALGYSDCDIAYFLDRNYGYKTVAEALK